MDNSPIIEILDLGIGFDFSKESGSIYPFINISAIKGELIALVGRNGVGKSTFLRSVAHLQKVVSGDVKVIGSSIKGIERSSLSKLISFIPAEPIHAANMTVKEFVTIARYPYHGWFGNLTVNDNEIVQSALESVNLYNFSAREIDSLSDGERQRAMIAFAIAQDSQIVLMDEPTAFIDLPNKFEIVRLLKDLANRGKTVIFSTHDLHTALREVDTIWLMLENGIVSGSPEDLALNGSLNILLEGTDVYLDLKTGGFLSKRIGDKYINLISNDETYFEWTKHAVERIGFQVNTEINKRTPTIKCLVDNGRWIWCFKQDEFEMRFSNISSMCNYLKSLY